jgi:hypothetical protein
LARHGVTEAKLPPVIETNARTHPPQWQLNGLAEANDIPLDAVGMTMGRTE